LRLEHKKSRNLPQSGFTRTALAIFGGIAKRNQMKTLAIGGASDHVHILLSLPATSSVAKAMQLLKGNSSKWIREIFPTMHSFGWQALAQNKESLVCRVRQLYGGT